MSSAQLSEPMREQVLSEVREYLAAVRPLSMVCPFRTVEWTGSERKEAR